MVKALTKFTALVAGTATGAVIPVPNDNVGRQVAPAASSARHMHPNLASFANANAHGAQGYTGRNPSNTLVPRKKGGSGSGGSGSGGSGSGSDGTPCIPGTYYTTNGKEKCFSQGNAAEVGIVGTILLVCAVCSASKSVRKKGKAAVICCGQLMKRRDNANTGRRSHGADNNIPLQQRGSSNGNQPHAHVNWYQTGNAPPGQSQGHAYWYNHPNASNGSSNYLSGGGTSGGLFSF